MKAHHDDWCRQCHGQIRTGKDDIFRGPNGYQHEECPSPVPVAKAVASCHWCGQPARRNATTCLHCHLHGYPCLHPEADHSRLREVSIPDDEEGQAAFAGQSDRAAKAYYAHKYMPFVEQVLAEREGRCWQPEETEKMPQDLKASLAEIRKRLQGGPR